MKAHQPGGAEWTKQLDSWRNETMADPHLGKTPDERKANIQKGVDVIRRYGSSDPAGEKTFKEFLDNSGIGEHPAAVRFFAWLGRAMGEQQPIIGSPPGSGKKSDAELFYGSTPETPAA